MIPRGGRPLGVRWSLSPAYDVVYAYNPKGRQTWRHQMSINGRRDHLTVSDRRQVGRVAALKRSEAEEIFAQVAAAVTAWPQLASEAELDRERIDRIARSHRLELPRR